MRTAIFSDKEREALTKFLENGDRSGTFKRVLIHRIKNSQIQIMEDFDLMIKVLKELEKESRHA